MGKKHMLSFISVFLLTASYNKMSAQQGQAILFDYDANGQRVLRHYDPNVMLAKNGDTLNHQSPPDTIIGLKGITKESILVRAYPNPVADEMIVENLSWKEQYKAVVKIFDITGKLVTATSFVEARRQFSLASVVPGTYHVHYYLNSQLLTTWKIIKK